MQAVVRTSASWQEARQSSGVTSFEEFYRDSWPWAFRLALMVTRDRGLAEDLTQDTFTRLHLRFDEIENPDAFLRVSVLNACRSYFRGRLREQRRLRRIYTPPTELSPPVRELLDAVGRLPHRQRTVIVLRYYEDLSEHDIADALGCRPGTVKSLASRALDTLSKEVDP